MKTLEYYIVVTFDKVLKKFFLEVPDFPAISVGFSSVEQAVKKAPQVIADHITELYEKRQTVLLKTTPLKEVSRKFYFPDQLINKVLVEIPVLTLARNDDPHYLEDVDAFVDDLIKHGKTHADFLAMTQTAMSPEVLATKNQRDAMNACITGSIIALSFNADSLSLQDIFRVYPDHVRDEKVAEFKLTPEYHRYIKDIFFGDDDQHLAVGGRLLPQKTWIMQLAVTRFLGNLVSGRLIEDFNNDLINDETADESLDFFGLTEAAFYALQENIEVTPENIPKIVATYDFQTMEAPASGQFN